jgi:YVTN family beta-propeller protein
VILPSGRVLILGSLIAELRSTCSRSHLQRVSRLRSFHCRRVIGQRHAHFKSSKGNEFDCHENQSSLIVQVCLRGTKLRTASLPAVDHWPRPKPARMDPFFADTIYSSNSVSTISTATNTVVSTIAVGNAPIAVAITPNAKLAYVANGVDDTVPVINPATNYGRRPSDCGKRSSWRGHHARRGLRLRLKQDVQRRLGNQHSGEHSRGYRIRSCSLARRPGHQSVTRDFRECSASERRKLAFELGRGKKSEGLAISTLTLLLVSSTAAPDIRPM